jgi:hypothetical protein
MSILNNKEKEEFKKFAYSSNLRDDLKRLSKRKYDKNKESIDKFLVFLEQYNQFINHPVKKFRKIIDKNMRL